MRVITQDKNQERVLCCVMMEQKGDDYIVEKPNGKILGVYNSYEMALGVLRGIIDFLEDQEDVYVMPKKIDYYDGARAEKFKFQEFYADEWNKDSTHEMLKCTPEGIRLAETYLLQYYCRSLRGNRFNGWHPSFKEYASMLLSQEERYKGHFGTDTYKYLVEKYGVTPGAIKEGNTYVPYWYCSEEYEEAYDEYWKEQEASND